MIGQELTDREKYLKRLAEEEEQSKLNRLKRIKKAKLQEQEKQKYLLQIKEHSTGLINWKNINQSLSWDGLYENTKYFTVSHGINKYSLVVMPAVKKNFPEQTKKITTSFELSKVQKAAENMMGNILKEIEQRKKEKENKESGTQGHIPL
jgi:hypothetical protein